VGRVVFALRGTGTQSRRNGGGKDKGQRWMLLQGSAKKRGVCVCVCVSLCESVSESDGSLPLSLSSRRTNYKVMDSRLITRVTSGFKLARSWCGAWCDGAKQERREGGGGGQSRGKMR